MSRCWPPSNSWLRKSGVTLNRFIPAFGHVVDSSSFTGLLLSVVLLGCSHEAAEDPDVVIHSERPQVQLPQQAVLPSTDSNHPEKISATVQPQFRMIGAESGFDFTRFDDTSNRRRITEVNGGGVAILDFDQDGLEDIFMTNGRELPFDPGESSPNPGQLFRNLGSMSFAKSTQMSGLRQDGFGTGCTVGDWDNDGFADLYVAAFGANQFWMNNGDGTFSAINSEIATDVTEWSSSAAFADVNGDGWLDLYVVNYLNESAQDPRLCPNPASPDGYEGCSPSLYEGVADRLFLSNGTWDEVDRSDRPVIRDARGKGLGVVIADFDDDAAVEIYVANDGEANQLYRIEPPSTKEADRSELVLSDIAFEANVALNESGYAQAGMGVTAADYDRNGTLDLFVTHFYGDTNTLYSNLDRMFFKDATRQSRLGPPSRETLGFGTAFADFNHDGWPDVLVANGHVDNREWIDGGQPYRMPPQCFLNKTDGIFTDASLLAGPYFQRRWLGRGLAVSDLDLDGRLDVAISHQLDPSVILQNQTDVSRTAGLLRLVGTTNHRDAIGTSVQIKSAQPSLRRWIVGGGSFQSSGSKHVHLPRDGSDACPLRIRWPDGSEMNVNLTDQSIATIVQGRATVYAMPAVR